MSAVTIAEPCTTDLWQGNERPCNENVRNVEIAVYVPGETFLLATNGQRKRLRKQMYLARVGGNRL